MYALLASFLGFTLAALIVSWPVVLYCSLSSVIATILDDRIIARTCLLTFSLFLFGVPILPYLAFDLYTRISEAAHDARYLISDYCRSGALARWVHAFVGFSFSEHALKQLAALPTDKKYVFCCEPHNPMVLHAALGFAAHGGTTPAALARKTLVVADTLVRYIPIVREIMSLYGVIGRSKHSLKDALDDGYSLAIIPSGLVGKARSLLDVPPASSTDQIVHIYRRRTKLGFIKLAVDAGASLVPVLEPNESHAYTLYNRHWQAWPFVLIVGRRLLAPTLPITVYVGEPISTVGVDASDSSALAAIADQLYERMAALAPPGVRVVYRAYEEYE